MWNDQETALDLLGHVTLARTITSLIRESRLLPLTIGIYGDWGAGKSSILKMVESELQSEKTICCLTFNGWLFQGYDDTKAALIAAIIVALEQSQPANEKLKSKAKELLQRVDWLRLAHLTAGLVWSGLAAVQNQLFIPIAIDKLRLLITDPTKKISQKDAKSLVDSLAPLLRDEPKHTLPGEISAFRAEFQELLKAADVKQLVVLVDDLDRCLPGTSIEVLEAIRLFLFVPGTVFVLAADENMIAYAVKKHFPDLPVTVGPSDFTRNYLEKLVQIPFRIPPMNKSDTRTYISLLMADYVLKDEPAKFKQICDESAKATARPWEGRKLQEDSIIRILGEIPERLKSALLMAERISGPLTEGVRGNPRQIKRFMNTLMVRLRVAESNGLEDLVAQDVLAKLMLLERFDEAVYLDIGARAAKSSDGRAPVVKALEEYDEKASLEGKAVQPAASDREFPQGWLKDQWLLAWAKIDPPIADVDLRPYIYISRDKIPGFAASSGLRDEIEEIARVLSEGQPLIIAGHTEHISKLSADDALIVFDYLADQAKQASDWTSKPQQMEGLYAIAKAHRQLQGRLVALLGSLPMAELGPWAATGMEPILADQSAKTAFVRLCQRWAAQDENGDLKSAAELVLQL